MNNCLVFFGSAVLIDPVYLPIFLRIESEIADYESTGDVISRARAVAARHKAVA